MSVTVHVELPADLARFRLPAGVAARLQRLLDQQEAGQPLTPAEREEAEGLVDLVELLDLLRLRAERAAGKPTTLDELLSGIKPENLHREWTTGPGVGAELP